MTVAKYSAKMVIGALALTASVAAMAKGNLMSDAAHPTDASPRVKKNEGTDRSNTGDIVVTASRLDMLGKGTTASEGRITADEVALRPIYRPGQLLETVPGLVVTAHSGEGKASQYLLRGFNLDHGTDFASFLDGMPINRPTNTHGQGYADQNFIMPMLIGGIDFTKGPYHAEVGDFGAVGSAHMRLVDHIPTTLSLSAGTLGDYGVSGGTTIALAPDHRLLLAGEYGHLDGPWTHPDDFDKVNLAARYSQGTTNDGTSLTALYYASKGNLTTDQPRRAVRQGLIDPYGTLDPSDGSRSHRFSLSARFAKPIGDATIDASAYYIRSDMILWNDFTHYLDDPVNGDQEKQYENRDTAGGRITYRRSDEWLGRPSVTTIGLQARYDRAYVARLHTKDRVPLSYCSVEGPNGTTQVPAAGGICNADDVTLLDLGGFVENSTDWTPWLRSTIGLREEYYGATDTSRTTRFSGHAHQLLFQPKGSIAIRPFDTTEFYISAGRGFHSDDVRGVFGTVPQQGVPGSAGRTPLLARAVGYEFGLRTNAIRRLAVQFALFRQDFESELAYNADVGQDSASAPSRRVGIELSSQYHPTRWLELNADIAFAKARYRGDLKPFGLTGRFIANAPRSTLSFGALVKDLGPWFGGFQIRNLGPYPLVDGPREPHDPGYTEANLDVGYHLGARTTVQLSIFNMLNTHANASAYYYATRLRGEPDDGVEGYQFHPLEPRSARLRLTETF